MTDATTNAPDGGQPAAASRGAPQIAILAQFVRKLTFDNAGALEKPAETPKITVNINVDASKRGDGQYLVALRLSAEAKAGEARVYAMELDYAGVFSVEGVEAKVLEAVLLVECPRLLFPFARRIVADCTRDGGYQPMMLDPVDFVALYRNELERRKAAGGGQAPQPSA